MTYELAKALKEAGFKQSGIYGRGYILPPGRIRLDATHFTWNDAMFKQARIDPNSLVMGEEFEILKAYVPTFEELIEACGEGDFRFDSSSVRSVQIWHATFLGFEDRAQVYQGEGSTPLEAVARLYIALNNKATQKDG